jgi:tripartite-type tricarboxylate transporter receptor subunit TctC
MFALHLSALALSGRALSATAALVDRTITIVVPFPAGSAADANVRVLAEKLRTVLNQSVVIDNRAGANGIIGTNTVVRAPADGYTLLYHSASLVISPWLIKDAPDPTRTLVPIGQVASTPYILAVRTGLGIRSLAEFIAYGKAQPGRLSCSTYGIGSPPHLALELFKQSAGINVLHVPYKGGFAQALVDLSSGQLDCAMDLPANVLPHVRAGKLVLIGSTSASDLASVKDVALISAAYPNAMVAGWSGLFAPAGTPSAVVARLEQALHAALSDAGVLAMLNNVGMSPSSTVTRDEFVHTVDSDFRRFGTIIKTSGIELQ